ncbi:hypothetical protein R75777_07714 [Paraburkholderia nemoris]|nr:hypothetical protein R75777_07714 [Paraburkholderia nemoris]
MNLVRAVRRIHTRHTKHNAERVGFVLVVSVVLVFDYQVATAHPDTHPLEAGGKELRGDFVERGGVQRLRNGGRLRIRRFGRRHITQHHRRIRLQRRHIRDRRCGQRVVVSGSGTHVHRLQAGEANRTVIVGIRSLRDRHLRACTQTVRTTCTAKAFSQRNLNAYRERRARRHTIRRADRTHERADHIRIG